MWCEAILSESDNVFTFILPSFFLFFFFFFALQVYCGVQPGPVGLRGTHASKYP